MSDLNKTNFCPTCGSPAIDASLLAGGVASCRSCAWTGQTTELLVHHFQHSFSSEEEILRAFSSDLKTLFAKEYGLPLLQILMKWGFLGKPEPKQLGRYLANIARSVYTAIVQTREELEKGDRP